MALLLHQRGLKNKEIGQDIGRSPHTVRDHISSMLLRFALKGRTALSIFHAQVSVAPQVGLNERCATKDRRQPPVWLLTTQATTCNATPPAATYDVGDRPPITDLLQWRP